MVKSDSVGEQIACHKCGNDTFIIKESEFEGLSIGCSKCGEGTIFGAGLSARTIVSILKNRTLKTENLIAETLLGKKEMRKRNDKTV